MAKEAFAEENIIISMFSGMWKSRCLSVVVSFAIPELLCESKEPVSIQDIAEKTGCRTDEQIYRVMRTMAQWGIGVEISGEKRFKANRAMELLRRDKGPSLGHMVGYYGSNELWTAMLAFPEAIKNGDGAFELAHGMNTYEYMNKVQELEYCPNKRKPENVAQGMGTPQGRCDFADNYDQAMNMLSQIELFSAQPSVFTVYPWDKCNRIMDVGGGEGQFLSHILKLPGCEHIHGILLDFPNVVERAKEFVAKEGILDGRMTVVAGDILKEAPQLKGIDTIIVKNFLGTFQDDEIIKIVENCRKVLEKGGKFVIVNSCNPEAGDKDHNVTRLGLPQGFRGIHTMTLCKGGWFRTKREWISLANKLCTRVGAFQLNQVYDTGDGPALFEIIKCS